MISGEGFSKSEHLVKTGDFRRAYKEGASFKKDWLTLYRLSNRSTSNRVGFAVSARAISLATRRNRIKRILREIYRKTKKDLKTGFDIVLSVKRAPSVPVKFDDTKNIFFELSKKAGLLR
jgi:ribonuclease P protein component